MINLKVDVVLNQFAVLLKSSAEGRSLMQTEIIDTILNMFSNPLVLILTIWIIGVIVAVAIFRRPKGTKDEKPLKETKKTKLKAKGPLMKQIGKMMSDADRGKELTPPPVHTRREIISDMFESKMNAIGLEASTASGYVPVSYTPLARFLKDLEVPEDTVGAIIEAILEANDEDEVRGIIVAAAESPEVNLVGNELNKAIQLAINEWANIRNTSES